MAKSNNIVKNFLSHFKTRNTGLKELIGKECRLEFDLPPAEWPISGFPAWVIVDDVDMPMIKMRSQYGGHPMWLNTKLIKRIALSITDE